MDEATARLADLIAVKDLSHRYAVALDRNDMAEWARLFAPGATLSSSAALPRGLAEILEMPQQQLRRYSRTQHLVSTQMVELAGRNGRGRVYCTAHHFLDVLHVGKRYKAEACHTFDIVYHDEYLKVEEDWTFLLRHVEVIARRVTQTLS